MIILDKLLIEVGDHFDIFYNEAEDKAREMLLTSEEQHLSESLFKEK